MTDRTPSPPSAEADPNTAGASEAGFGGRRYAAYALILLAIVNFLNYFDRNLLTILAEEVKRDLSLSDAQLGFLYGTAFSVLFAVVGIPMGRISDRVSRTKLLGLALALWSAMTMLSGAAGTFLLLAFARIGVGLGEATANPCSNSLLADYFPKDRRAGAMSVYLVGVLVGGAAALAMGGAMIEHWPTLCAQVPWGGACGVKGWHAAFYIAGLPGLVLAILVFNLREPTRRIVKTTTLARAIIDEFSASTPPFTLWSAARVGGARGLARNIGLAAILMAIAAALAWITGDILQWALVALGAYAIGSWIQGVTLRDPPFYKVTFGCPTFVLTLVGMCLTTIIGNSVQFWAAPYALRNLDMQAGAAGALLGAIVATGSLVGILGGGVLTDRWKRRDERAPMWMTLIALLGSAPFTVLMFTTRDPALFLGAFFMQALISHIWSGGAAAFIQDMVLPRMRGAAAAGFSLVIILVSLAFGPYWVGRISTSTGSLSLGVFSIHILLPLAALALVLAARRMPAETEDARRARARAAGEPD